MIAAIEAEVEHRPWPLPSGPWIMFQSWRDLLFIHWRVPASELRPLVPPALTLEEYDGSAWIGLTPFRLVGLRIRGLPAIPTVSSFPEMNLRTYVRSGGRSGIWFFSLDAGSRLAVLGARAIYRLPYFHARMEVDGAIERGEAAPAGAETRVEKDPEGGRSRRTDAWVRYRSRRGDRRVDGNAEFRGRYRPSGDAFEPDPGTLEHFLVERYALYATLGNGRVLRGEIHHRPWRLRPAEAEIERNTVPRAHGIAVGEREPLLHVAARQDTLVWPPTRA